MVIHRNNSMEDHLSVTQANVSVRRTSSSVERDNSAPISVDPEELIDAIEAARLLRQKPQTLAAWRSEKRGPAYIKIGRSIFYRRMSIGAYLAASIVTPGAA